jgi:hypothetical protein
VYLSNGSLSSGKPYLGLEAAHTALFSSSLVINIVHTLQVTVMPMSASHHMMAATCSKLTSQGRIGLSCGCLHDGLVVPCVFESETMYRVLRHELRPKLQPKSHQSTRCGQSGWQVRGRAVKMCGSG